MSMLSLALDVIGESGGRYGLAGGAGRVASNETARGILSGGGRAAAFMGGSRAASMAVGGMSGSVMAGEDNRMKGFAAGAIGGLAGGAGMRGYSRRGTAVTNSALKRTAKMAGHTRTPAFIRNAVQDNMGSVRNAAAGFHRKSNRNAIFRSGAMLGGGAFGLMFASNGRSHKRGFNSNRGNSFTR